MKQPDIFTRSAQQAVRIAELETQLAECRKLRTDYRMGIDPIEYNDLYYRAESEIDGLRAQLAAAQGRERTYYAAIDEIGQRVALEKQFKSALQGCIDILVLLNPNAEATRDKKEAIIKQAEAAMDAVDALAAAQQEGK